MSEHESNGKSAAITAYILIVGVLIAISMNYEEKNPFATFHIRQAGGLSIMFIALGLIVSPFDNWMISSSMYLFLMVLWGFGLYTAIAGRMQPVPLVGSFFQKYLKRSA